MSELREMVRAAVRRIEQGDEATAQIEAEALKKELAKRGLGPGCHIKGSCECILCRFDVEWGDNERTVEWYAGQIVEAVEGKKWFAINSIINCLDKFCPVGTEVPR